MTIVQWPDEVNSHFYGKKDTPDGGGAPMREFTLEVEETW